MQRPEVNQFRKVVPDGLKFYLADDLKLVIEKVLLELSQIQPAFSAFVSV